jgi:hypothetical protein
MSPSRAAALLALLSACSLYARDDDDDNGPVDAPMPLPLPIDAPSDALTNEGFVRPSDVTRANVLMNGVWTEVGLADWTCLGTASSDQPSTGAIALTGRVEDRQTGNGVGAATITAWSSASSASLGDATTSNDPATRGNFTMSLAMLPSTTRRYNFSLVAQSYVPTRVLGRYYAPGAAATDNLPMLSDATAQALPAFIGLERDPAAALVWGSMRDCQGRMVSNAAVGLSFTPSIFQNAGGETFYFSAGSTSLPVRHTVAPVMNRDGMFIVLNAVPNTTAYIQVWGFKTFDELTTNSASLLAEIQTALPASEAVLLTLDPRRNGRATSPGSSARRPRRAPARSSRPARAPPSPSPCRPSRDTRASVRCARSPAAGSADSPGARCRS